MENSTNIMYSLDVGYKAKSCISTFIDVDSLRISTCCIIRVGIISNESEYTLVSVM